MLVCTMTIPSGTHKSGKGVCWCISTWAASAGIRSRMKLVASGDLFRLLTPAAVEPTLNSDSFCCRVAMLFICCCCCWSCISFWWFSLTEALCLASWDWVLVESAGIVPVGRLITTPSRRCTYRKRRCSIIPSNFRLFVVRIGRVSWKS